MSDKPLSIHDLVDLIKDFLKEPRESQGGYAEVKDGDVRDLNKIIKTILELKYEEDPDGDLPIDWAVVDRTKYYHPFLNYAEMKYPHKLKTLNDYLSSIQQATMNLSIAQEEVRKITNYIFLLLKQSNTELGETIINDRYKDK